MIKEINIKEDFPPVDVAVANMENEIDVNKKFGDSIIKIVHGYGSHGIGGAIKIGIREKLEIMKRRALILDYIKGESFTSKMVNDMKISTKLKQELLCDSSIDSFNSGMTVIIIKDENKNLKK